MLNLNPWCALPQFENCNAGVMRTENSDTDGKGVDGSHSEEKRYRVQEVCLFDDNWENTDEVLLRLDERGQ